MAKKCGLVFNKNGGCNHGNSGSIELTFGDYVYQDRHSCEAGEYYDIFYFKCIPCEKWEESVEHQPNSQIHESYNNVCVCKKNFKRISQIDFNRFNCTKCDLSKSTTTDQLSCAKCPEAGCDVECKENEILVDRALNGEVVVRECVKCISGTNPNKEKTKCEPCLHDPLNSSQSVCIPCPNGYELVENECFQSTKLISNSRKNIFKQKYKNGKEVESKFFHEKLRQTSYKCQYHHSPQSCSALLNLCVLQLYNNDGSDSPCQIYSEIQTSLDHRKHKDIGEFMLPSISESESLVKEKTDISTIFSFRNNDEHSLLPLKLARYEADGSLISIENATPNALQICPNHYSNSFVFGSWCNQVCSIKTSYFWTFGPMVFYELFVEYIEDGKIKLFPVQVKNLNNKMKVSKNDNQLFRRFFIVDNLSGIPVGSKEKKAKIIRYARNMDLRVQLDHENLGKIFPPLLTISYGEIHWDEIDSSVEVSFRISYWMNQDKINEDVTVAISIFSVLAVILSALHTWSWSKRSGRITIDIKTLVKMIFHLCGNLSNAFLLVFSLVSIIRLIFYKEQIVPYMVAPTNDQELSLYHYTIAAFCLKCVHLFHNYYVFTDYDVFFIDWERPRLSSQGDINQNPISIWRNYYIVREWKKLLTYRKTNAALNLLALLIFLKVLKFEDLALLKHNSTPTNECEPFSQTFRFALVVSLYFLAAFIQTAYYRLIRDTFLGDRITRFIDLCSVCNVSMLIFAYNQFGYYIHGRSVHGHADTDMKQFNEHLKREEDNLCSQRGLVPNTSLQSFTMFVTPEFRQQYNKIYLPAITEGNVTIGRSQLFPEVTQSFSKLGALSDKFILSYQTMNKFLSAFIDHALQDLDYIVKNKLATEKLLNIEFQEPTDVTFFYNDPENSFTNILFYGHELDFLVWESLLVSLIDIIVNDFLLSIVITFFCYKILEKLCAKKAKWNTASKSLLDRRFLI